MNKEAIAQSFRDVQLYICQQLEQLDGVSTFSEDEWTREEGGGGYTRTIVDGAVIEKGGVAFSAVHGPVSEAMKLQLKMEGESFFATGVSIVLHPKHPRHPIIHMNVRYFELNSGVYWFGGGIDLTPHYIHLAQAKLFHQGLKDHCDKFHQDFYTQFKPWADRYFHLPHRGETRGIGGIFFDHLDEKSGLEKSEIASFCVSLARLFPELYAQQIHTTELKSPSERELNWQRMRRARYVEFNLLHDRGTKFGIYSGGRTESILMSMPPRAEWSYNYAPEVNSEEAQTLNWLKNNPDWMS